MGGKDAFDCAAWCSAELGPPPGPIWPEKKGWFSGCAHNRHTLLLYLTLCLDITGFKGWFGGAKSGAAAAAAGEAADGAAVAELPADADGGEFDPDADDSDEDS
jgi:hypothetical protein